MDKDIAIEIASKLVPFLSEHGVLPAIKEREQRIQDAEDLLGRRLVRAQAGLESKFIQALRDRGHLPSRRSEQLGLINQVFGDTFIDMRGNIADAGVEVADLGRQLVFEDLAEQGMRITTSSFSEGVKDELYSRIYEFSDESFQAISGNFEETLSRAYEDGIGIDDAATRLRRDFKGLRDYRLRSIARTEIQSAQNEGTQKTMEEIGTEFKQWITVGDTRVRGNGPNDRYDHTVLHGEVVKVKERFSNGLKYPGDKSGDIGDWIQCRCRERPYIPRRDENILSTPYYPSAS